MPEYYLNSEMHFSIVIHLTAVTSRKQSYSRIPSHKALVEMQNKELGLKA